MLKEGYTFEQYPDEVADQLAAEQYFFQAEHLGELAPAIPKMDEENLRTLTERTERSLGRMGYTCAHTSEQSEVRLAA